MRIDPNVVQTNQKKKTIQKQLHMDIKKSNRASEPEREKEIERQRERERDRERHRERENRKTDRKIDRQRDRRTEITNIKKDILFNNVMSNPDVTTCYFSLPKIIHT